MKKEKIDVSVILNTHNEFSYIRQTLHSLAEDIEYAIKNDVSCELIVVCDSSSDEFFQYLSKLICCVKTDVHLFRVSFSSLGKSRNFGIDRAKGCYICTADADDLTSENCLLQMFKTAKRFENAGLPVAVFPEFVVNFQDSNFITRKISSKYFSSYDWAYMHPFCSKLLINKNFFNFRKYQEFSTGSVFSYEDWEFNSHLLRLGVRLEVAHNTILFYRQHKSSMMRETEKTVPLLENISPFLSMPTKRRPFNINKPDIQKLNRLVLLAREIEPQIQLITSDAVLTPLELIPKNNWTLLLGSIFSLTGMTKFDIVYLTSASSIENFNQAKNKFHNLNLFTLIVICGKGHLSDEYFGLMREVGLFVLDFRKIFGWLRISKQKKLLEKFLFCIAKENSKLIIDDKLISKKIINIAATANYYQIETEFENFKLNSDTKYDIDEKNAVTQIAQFLNIQEINVSKKVIVKELKNFSLHKRFDLDIVSDIAYILKKFPHLYKFAKKIYRTCRTH